MGVHPGSDGRFRIDSASSIEEGDGLPIGRRELIAGGGIVGVGAIAGAFVLTPDDQDPEPDDGGAEAEPEPDFAITHLDPPEATVRPGDPIEYTATVENTGEASGTVEVEFLVAEKSVGTAERSLDPGERNGVDFGVRTDDFDHGEHSVEARAAEDTMAGILTIEGVPADHVPFSIWGEMREGIRESPDHLPARAERLVETGDLEEIFAFVRDEIVTVPPKLTSFTDTVSVGRWGPRGALRSGTGTPRDKADLLAALYARAGYESEVKVASSFNVEDVGLDAEAFRQRTLQPVEREFDPAIDEEMVADWMERAGEAAVANSNQGSLDLDGTEAEALANQLREHLPEDPADRGFRERARSFAWEWHGGQGDRAPIVAVNDGSGETYANLFADVPFGDPGSSDEPSPAPDPEYDTVSVTLSAATVDDVENRFPLVSGEWTVPELIGRQLRIRTPSMINPLEFPNAGVHDLEPFMPSISLQGMDMTEAEMAEHAVFGAPFTLGGDRMSVDYEIDGEELHVDEDTLRRNGDPIDRPPATGDITEIDTIDIDVSAVSYPSIQLDVFVRDSDGEPVGDLPLSAFAATDEDHRVFPAMGQRLDGPTILLVRDVSASMGRVGFDPAADDDATYEDLRASIRDLHPNATIEYREVDSAMWSHLADAIADGPDAIVYAHDGLPADTRTEGVDIIYPEAPPTVLLSADEGPEVEATVIHEQAELTGADIAPIGDWEQVEEAIDTVVGDVAVPTYRFEYGVPDTQAGERTVELHAGEDPIESPTATTEATYQVETGTPRRTARGVVGLYLEIEMGDRRITRTIAGYDPVFDQPWDPYFESSDPETGIGMPGAVDMAEEVHQALLGGIDLSFEGDGVPFSIAMDDMLGAKLTAEHLAIANLEGDVEEKRSAWEQGAMHVQSPLMAVQAPLADAVSSDGLTFFDGPRVAMYRAEPIIDEQQTGAVEMLDVMSLGRVMTAAEDANEGFWRTLERTAQIAVIERELFDTTAASLLSGTELREYEELDHSDWEFHKRRYRDIREDSAGLSRRDVLIAPADGSEFAFWNVDTNTGALIGVLSDGSGGGVRRVYAHNPGPDDIEAAIEVYMNILALLPVMSPFAGPALGAVAAYYAQLAVVYAEAGMMLSTLDPDRYTDVTDAMLGLFDAAQRGTVMGAVGSIPVIGDALAVIGLAENLAKLLGIPPR